MNTVMDTFAHYGLNQGALQALIIAGVVLVILGTYWKMIVLGCVMVFSFMVFSGNPSTSPVEPVAAVKPVQPVESEQQRWHRQFLEDCTNVAENSKETCENIWNDRMMEESHLEVNPDAEIQPAKYVKHRKVRYD